MTGIVMVALAAVVLPLAGGTPAAAQGGPGYWLVASDGGIFSFGDAPFHGSTGGLRLNRPIVGMAESPAGDGYWLVASDGGIFSFGDARFYGSTGNIRLNQPIAGMAPTKSGGGYWLVAADGGIFAFGDAPFLGSTGDLRLVRPVVGMAATPSGNGYWMVAEDGGIFTFGDAVFHGSAAGMTTQRVVGMAVHPDGGGYWIATAEGTLFAFGSARLAGTVQGPLNRPIVAIGASATGNGYWLVGADGGIFSFGDAPFLGSTGGLRLNRPIVGMAPRGAMFPAESKLPGTYTERSDTFIGITVQGGRVTEAVSAIADCFCHQRLGFSIGLRGEANQDVLHATLSNVSGVPMRFTDGVRVVFRVTSGGQHVADVVGANSGVQGLAPGQSTSVAVGVPALADGRYDVVGETVIVLE